MGDLRVVLIVSTDPSDLYFGNRLARRLNTVGIVVEDQRVTPPLWPRVRRVAGRMLRPWQLPKHWRGQRIFADHLRRSDAIDRKGFGEDGYRLQPPDGCRVLQVSGKGALNRPDTVEQVRQLEPDLLLLCGCSILKNELLSVPRLGSLNLHGGLSQRYRGIWTTLWAVANREPEYVGATVHFVALGIDDGDIVYQGRPEIDADDDPESLYVKVVRLGVEMMASAVEGIANGETRRHPLEQRGELYLSAMVTPDVLEKAWQAIEEGVLREYLSDRENRDAAVLQMMRGAFPTQGGGRCSG